MPIHGGISLAANSKKVLYLDQFFFSTTFLERDPRFQKAADRISRISSDQLLTVPYSSVHEDETHQWQGYAGKDREDLMNFIKSVSRGQEFKPTYEVEKNQILRSLESFLASRSPHFIVEEDDAIEGDLHQWEDYIRIDVGGYNGNIELIRDLKRQVVRELLEAFDAWRKSTNTFEEQISTEVLAIANGLITSYVEYRNRILDGDYNAIFNAPLHSTFLESMLEEIPHGSPPDKFSIAREYLSSSHFQEVPHVWIAARIFACLQEMVRGGAYANGKEAESKLTGLGQDIQHISTYAPYCDAFFMDKAMAHIVTDKRINLEAKYGVKVFSAKSLDRFNEWIDGIEAGITESHRAALSNLYPPIR